MGSKKQKPRTPMGVERRSTKAGWKFRARTMIDGRLVTGTWRTTAREAERDLARVRQRAVEAVEITDRWTLDEGMRRVILLLETKGRRQGTITDRQTRFRLLRHHFGGSLSLAKLHADDIVDFVQHRMTEDGVAASTAISDVRALQTVTRLAARKGALPFDPVERAKDDMPSADLGTKSHYYVEHELAEIIDTIRRSGTPNAARDAILVEFLAHSGLRLREATDLSDGDVDLRRRTIDVDGKRGFRRVKMSMRLVDLAKQINARRRGSGEAFLPISYWGIQGIFRRWKAKLRDARFHPHTLRHTCGTALARAGASPFAIRDHLGHATLSMASYYVKEASPADEALDAISFLVDNSETA